MTHNLDGRGLSAMLLNGYRNLIRNVELINDLNVFPVPDGDTGTNMARTLSGGVAAVKDEAAAGMYMKAFARGTLLSARGNSGVILSQFVHGLAEGMEGKTEIGLADFAYAMTLGERDAYHAVMQPTEGTILTLIRQGAAFLQSHSFDCFEDCFKALIAHLRSVLQHTPELLPVLKEAGVVDSGGAGLVCIFEGMEAALRGEVIESDAAADSSLKEAASAPTLGAFGPDSVLEYGYCTEFILQLMHAKCDIAAFSLQPMIDYYQSIGDSLVAVMDGDIVKIHVHTFCPEKVIDYARQFGEFITFKMENMSVQHNEVMEARQTPKEKYAVVAVTCGQGIEEYFKEIGVKVTVSGGQTQNPSAEEFLAAFRRAASEHIVVLPNNSNIILTARQAAELFTDAQVHVIETKSMAEGYSALSMMDLYADTVEELLESMTCSLGGVTTGQVTTATRDTSMNGVEIQQGDHIGLADHRILSAEKSAVDAALAMLRNLDNMDEKQVLTVFYGEDLTEAELEELQSRVEAEYPLLETGYIYGGQAVYSLIMAIE